MDLTPAPVGDAPVARRRRPLAYVVLLVVLGALGVVVYQALSSASLYFVNADDAVRERAETGDRRFRLQGTVLGGTVEEVAGGVQFCIAYGGARVEVHHDGDPPQMFEPGIPVVLEGRWDQGGADVFDSDRILVKHSAQYEAEHEDRLEEAQQGGRVGDEPAECSTRPAP